MNNYRREWQRRRSEQAKPAYEALMKYYPFTLDDLPGEVWKTIPDYEDYQGSNFGRVKSFKQGKARIMKPVFVNEGYLQIMLCKDGKSKWIRVHQLVALCFIPNPEGKPQVNHIDGCKLNCHVSNLEWVTRSENTRHAFDTGLQKSGEEHHKAKLTNEQVLYIRDNSLGLTAYQLAEMFGLSQSTIGRIQLGKSWKQASGSVRKENGNRKLNEQVRAQIRSEYQPRVPSCDYQALAKKYGVSPSTIRNIIHEKSDA